MLGFFFFFSKSWLRPNKLSIKMWPTQRKTVSLFELSTIGSRLHRGKNTGDVERVSKPLPSLCILHPILWFLFLLCPVRQIDPVLPSFPYRNSTTGRQSGQLSPHWSPEWTWCGLWALMWSTVLICHILCAGRYSVQRFPLLLLLLLLLLFKLSLTHRNLPLSDLRGV